MDIQTQIKELKAEITEVVAQIRCQGCNKLLAVRQGNRIVIRCPRCSHDHAIDYCPPTL